MEIEALRDRLLQRHPAHLVCGPDTDLVVEGYPRSANSFTMDMIAVQAATEAGAGARRIAHHTHSPDQLRLAVALDVPALVLIRTPAEAILSYSIYSGQEVAACLRRYRSFYTAVAALQGRFAVADFAEITADFNRVLARLNPLLARPLPLARDPAGAAAQARAQALARAERTHGALAARRSGVPNPERERLKAARRAEVQEAVAASPDLAALYRDILRAGGVPAQPG